MTQNSPSTNIPEPNGFPPIETVALTGHLPGQNSKGPLSYVVFSDEQGQIGALWRAMARGDEAVGWVSNYQHPAERQNTNTWRVRITTSQARSAAQDFNPVTERHYTAESFFRHWTEEVSHDPLKLDGPHDFAGSAHNLQLHLGWPTHK